MDKAKKITAQDLRHQQFSTKMRGYAREEVDEYLAIVAEFLKKEASEKAELEQRIKALEVQLEDFKTLEHTLKNTLIRTQESVDEVKRTAEREGELIIREAQVKADRMVEDKYDRLKKLESSYQGLRLKWDEYFVKFKNLLSSHMEILDKMQKDYEQLNVGKIERPQTERPQPEHPEVEHPRTEHVPQTEEIQKEKGEYQE
ncbi:MAG TPA: DivIVA domain-containing protein [candidate division Zixibacteria bacterium]|nr:DivIVA domain-containing protein [candidate division Zixibacteria bacterium]